MSQILSDDLAADAPLQSEAERVDRHRAGIGSSGGTEAASASAASTVTTDAAGTRSLHHAPPEQSLSRGTVPAAPASESDHGGRGPASTAHVDAPASAAAPRVVVQPFRLLSASGEVTHVPRLGLPARSATAKRWRVPSPAGAMGTAAAAPGPGAARPQSANWAGAASPGVRPGGNPLTVKLLLEASFGLDAARRSREELTMDATTTSSPTPEAAAGAFPAHASAALAARGKVRQLRALLHGSQR